MEEREKTAIKETKEKESRVCVSGCVYNIYVCVCVWDWDTETGFVNPFLLLQPQKKISVIKQEEEEEAKNEVCFSF